MRRLTTLLVALVAFLPATTAAAAPPPNDDFVNAAPLAGPPAQVVPEMGEATTEPQEPDLGLDPQPPYVRASVWWTYTAQRDGRVAFLDREPLGEPGEVVVAAYRGDTLGSLQLLDVGRLGAASGLRVAFNAQQGQTYHLTLAVIRGSGGGGGLQRWDMSFVHAPLPPNDDFAAATTVHVSHKPVRIEGTIIDATAQPGEPDHGEHSVWFRLRTRTERAVRVTAYGSGGSDYCEIPRLVVYTGRSLDALNVVTTGEDDVELALLTRPGQTYLVALALGARCSDPGYWITFTPVRFHGVGFEPGTVYTDNMAWLLYAGLSVNPFAWRPVTVSAVARVSARTARRLGLDQRTITRRARFVLSWRAPRRERVLRITRAARRELSDRDRLDAAIVMVVVDQATGRREIHRLVVRVRPHD
jgi:hypothetical protein